MLYALHQSQFLRAAVNDHGAELTRLTCKPDAYILEDFHSNYVDVAITISVR